jgi:pilus assembly protein CpaB
VTVVALFFAGLATWGVWKFMEGESQKVNSIQGENVVVAAADLPVGTKLDTSQIKTIPMPKDSISKGGFTDPAAVAGRVIIRALSAGDQITESKLMPKEGATAASGVMSYLVPQGHRAVTVGVNEVAGVAGFLAPNNRVDVVVTAPIPNNSKGETITKIVLQNVPLLATGQITEQKDGKPVIVPTVTLDLTPEDSEKLVQSSRSGSLQLLLRNIVDTTQIEGTRGMTLNKVLGSVERTEPAIAKAAPKKVTIVRHERKAAPAPVPTPVVVPRKHTVEIVKGKERTTKEFAE